MKRAMMSVLGWTALGFTLCWGLACGGPPEGLDTDGSASEAGPLTDPCAGAQGMGTYKGYLCPAYNIVTIQLSSCQAARSNCEFNAQANPKSSIYCTWKGTEIYRREKTVGSCPR